MLEACWQLPVAVCTDHRSLDSLLAALSRDTPSALVRRPTQHQMSRLPRYGAEAAKPLWKIEIIERGGMLSAIQEINSALDGEQWAEARNQCDSALERWPRWRALRTTRDRVADGPPPTDVSLVEIDEESLPSARAARVPKHIERMSDVLHKICDYLAHDYRWSPLWTSKKPFLASLIEDGPIEDEDVDEVYTMAYGPSVCGGGYQDPTNTCKRLVKYQRLRGVSTAWCQPLYSHVRRLCISFEWFAQMPPELGDRFPNVEALSITGEPVRHLSEAGYVRQAQAALPECLRRMPRLRALWLFSIQLQQFPDWFSELPLTELYVMFPRPDGSLLYDAFADASLLYPSWVEDEACLPRGLEVLKLECSVVALSLGCVRRLPHLRELVTDYSVDNLPAWLREVTSLRRLRGRATGSDAFLDADLLRDMSLEAVDYSTASMDQSDGLNVVGFVSTLERLVVGTACGASLRELNIGGIHLDAVPGCLRALRLQYLDVKQTGLTSLPQWLAELPLVALKVSDNVRLATLPSSLRSLTSLKVLELSDTNLGGPQPDRGPYGAPYVALAIGGELVKLDRTEAIAEADRRDAILQPLSVALPDLRIRLHSHSERHSINMLQIDADKYFWHAKCGFDWLDPVFYTDEDHRMYVMNGIEEARTRIRARRLAERARSSE